MERIVVVGYKPLPGKETALRALMLNHVDRLRAQNLVSDRKPILMISKSGVFIEVFGWKSREAIEAAHSNAEVQKMWGEYAAVCEYVPVGSVEEIGNLFSEFSPMN